MKKAVVLLSGGLDSATVLAIANKADFQCYALSINYGQRHAAELEAAMKIAKHFEVTEYKTIHLNLADFGGSALTDKNIAVPTQPTSGIPVTYVPARNTIMLSLALGWAEVLGSHDIFIGVNAIDYSGYPDCRSEYIAAFQTMANLATKTAVEGNPIKIHTPLINLSKAQIIEAGTALKVDYGMTVSCYAADAQGRACGRCDACRLRCEGFSNAHVPDPTRYANN